MNIEEQKNKTAKQIKALCLIIGFVYVAFAAFSLLIIGIQMIMLSYFKLPPDEISNNIHPYSYILLIFLSIIILLGIAYIVYGFSFKKIKKNAYRIQVILRIISIILAVCYSIANFDILPEITRGLRGIIMIFMFIVFGFIIFIAAFSIPQYFINKKVKKFIALGAT